METSPFVMILLSGAATASVWAFVIKIKADLNYRDFLHWVRAAYPVEWNSLPWGGRVLFPQAGIAQLRRNGHNRDPAFEGRYQAAKQAQRRMWTPLVIGITCIAAVILGTKLFDWPW
jgi:hypothetical protein